MGDLSQCRVLIVDDTKTNIDILAQGLAEAYKLSIALDGESALKSVRSKPADLILLDIMMPGMDGYEVCRQLKNDPKTNGIPVIFVTAMDEIENKTFGFELGAVDYITKPFEMSEVQARVSTHLQLKQTIEQLQHEISERKKMQVQLIQNEKMAGIGLLASGIAHEINNPTVAFKRGTDQLIDVIKKISQFDNELEALLPRDEFDHTKELGAKISKSGFQGQSLSSRECRKLAKEYEKNLESIGIKDFRNVSQELSRMGLSKADLNTILEKGSTETFLPIISYLNSQFELGSIINMMTISADRILRITKSLKRYSHIDRSPEGDVYIEDGIEDTLLILQNELKYGVEIEKDYHDVSKIACYPSELAQVWTNIIHNAAQAMNGKGKLKIETFEEGDYVGARFTDSGPGIPEEFQEKVFDPFYSTKDQGVGTGLGLNICYQIVEKHGGRIDLFSKPGTTTFEVWLPKETSTEKITEQKGDHE